MYTRTGWNRVKLLRLFVVIDGIALYNPVEENRNQENDHRIEVEVE